MNRKFLVVMLFMITSILYSFEEGFIWGLRANFNGSLTLPSISQEDLDKMGAASMKGAVGYTMDGEAELGYLFGAERWFGKEKSGPPFLRPFAAKLQRVRQYKEYKR